MITCQGLYGHYMNTVGKRISYIRRKLGISQAQFASDLNVDIQTVSRWERDLVFPRINKIEVMAEKYKVRPEYVLGGAGEPFATKEEVLPPEKYPVAPIIERLKEALKLTTDIQVALILGIPEDQLRMGRMYNEMPPLNKLFQIADQCEINYRWLFTGRGIKSEKLEDKIEQQISGIIEYLSEHPSEKTLILDLIRGKNSTTKTLDALKAKRQPKK